MAQHDYVIENQTGAQFRADLNNVLTAIQTINSGTTEPIASIDYQLWHDTTLGALKQRHSGSYTGLRIFQPRIFNGILDANGNEMITFTATAAAVNDLTIANNTSGQPIKFNATSSVDTNVGMAFFSQGNSSERALLRLTATPVAVNEFTIANAATGNAPTLSVTGTDTNINLTLTPKGGASVFVPAGTVTNPSISISTDSNTGIYFPSADTMGFVEGGNGYQIGYRNVPSSGNEKTSTYEIAKADCGKLITIGGSGGSIVVPRDVFSAGDIIYIYNNTNSLFNITKSVNTVVLYKSGFDADVSSISVAPRTMGAIQYVSSTTAVFFSGSQDSTTFQLEYVIVGGGGGGGQGGGGGGGYIAGLNAGTVDGINYGSQEKQGGDNVNAEKPIWIKKGVAYSVSIGAGGAGLTALNTQTRNNGTNTYFNNLVAIGGGGGSPGFSLVTFSVVQTSYETWSAIIGGCGGAGWAGNITAFTRQGRLGGSAAMTPNRGQNGGGGASAVGVSWTSGANGNAGGAGITTNILSASETLSGGGGGGGASSGGSTGGAGGSGGGGAGGGYSGNGTDGSVNRGGGGGGCGYQNSPIVNGAGGSGVILLRYPTGITATSSNNGANPPVNDLTMTTGTRTVDGVTFNTLKITAGTGTITFN
jgi:hypothetical protein